MFPHSVLQSESTGSDLLVFPFWSIFSRGNPKGDHLLVPGPNWASEKKEALV